MLSPQNRFLLLQMVTREITAKYKNSALGLVWAILLPLVMLTVYSLIFQGVFKASWPAQEVDADFPLNVFAGLILFSYFSDTVVRAPNLISEQPNLVKKVVFPVELLVIVSVLNTLFFACISLVILILGVLFFKNQISVYILGLVPLIVIFTLMLLGLTFALSAIGVYFQDLKHIITMIVTPLLFLSPVFYPVSSVPEPLQKFMYLNPLTITMEQMRAILIGGDSINLVYLIIYAVVSLFVFFFGLSLFQAFKRGFSDAL